MQIGRLGEEGAKHAGQEPGRSPEIALSDANALVQHRTPVRLRE